MIRRPPKHVPSRHESHGAYRAGIVLFTTIVALLAATIIALGILRAAISQYGSIRDQRRQLQTEQLAQAAIGRALDRLRTAADYRGETWEVPADELGGPLAGEVLIEVSKPGVAGDDNTLKISVRADYPANQFYRSRQSRELLVTLKPRETMP